MKLALLSGLALQGPLESVILPAFERSTGVQVQTRWDPTTVIIRSIADGAAPDVTIVTDEAITQLAAEERVDGATVIRLAEAVLGVAVRRGAAKPEIGTAEEFRRALLSARSVAYSRAGASGIYLEALIERFSIAEAIRARATVIPSGLTAEKLVSGEADLAVQQMSELMMVEGVDVVGPFPPEIQSATGFSAGAMRSSAQPEAAAQLLGWLSSKEAQVAYREAGLIPR